MWELKSCAVCFSSDVKLLSMELNYLRTDFNAIIGVKTFRGDGLLDYLCVECSAYVKNFRKFRDKCRRAHYTLKQILSKNKQITKLNIDSIDRKVINLMPALSYLDPDKLHYEEIKFKWVKYNRLSVSYDKVPVVHFGTLTDGKITNGEIKMTNSRDLFLIKKDDQTATCDIDTETLKNQNIAENGIPQAPRIESNVKSYYEDFFEDEIITDDNNEDDIEVSKNMDDETKTDIIIKTEADGSNLDEEYATMLPLSLDEAKAANEIFKLFGIGKIRCKICNKSYNNKQRYELHLRMHDKYISGNFQCEICQNYYKSDFLLKTHMKEKHMYKYPCRQCSEVSFDRVSAKQHYIWVHLKKGTKKDAKINWYDCRPNWLRTRKERVVKMRPVKSMEDLPSDYIVCTPLPQEEQYTMVKDRQKSKNYIEAPHKCHLCFRGYREIVPFNNHLKKHDPDISGPAQCDMCKLYFKSARKLYKHIRQTHLFKFTCKICDFIGYSRSQAQLHYKWHKNVKYQCPHCDKEFTKASTKLTHIRIKHPSTYICNLCGHSFVSDAGLYCHKRLAHSVKDPGENKTEQVDKTNPLYCADCDIQFVDGMAFNTHLGSSIKHSAINRSITRTHTTLLQKLKGRAPRDKRSNIVNNGQSIVTKCDLCGEQLNNDVAARKHYVTMHPGADYLKRYMCDVCGHTTKQYANLIVHMRTHTREKPFECPHCERRFSMPSNRDRHLVVHTGEKKYQCQHCNRRFTQSSALKLHIQTVHLKIPYAPWDKKNRKRRKEAENLSAVISTTTPPIQTYVHTHPKIIIDPQSDYLNAYITYNE